MIESSAETLRLPERFQIDREIGRGGMAVVYRAHDHHLGRFVAIKVLSEGLSRSLGALRFEREIALMAKLVHPGIVALFDSGALDGRLYYVMPLVSGETLRARLAREHRLTPHDSASLGADIAEALAYAHGVGIVHRDVKPENIFSVSGRAVLADFGIARVQGDRSAASDLTSTGMVLGTVAYMSPEQAGGEPDVDGRSDLYSLGCVLYELLTGLPPFTAPTYLAMVGKHMTETPLPPSARGVAVPPALDELVLQLLAKEPSDRAASVGDVARLLRAATHSSAPALAVPVRAATAGTMRESVETVSIARIEIPLSDAECAALSQELPQAIAARLSALPGLRVAIGQAVSTDALTAPARDTTVHGSVRRSGNRVRVTMRVADTDGSWRWSQVIDGLLDDPFGLEDAVAESVAGHFGDRARVAGNRDGGPVNARNSGENSGGNGAARGSRTGSGVDQLVADGLKAFNMFGPTGGAAAKGHFEEAKAYFTRALAIDPHHARGLCALGNWYSVAAVSGMAPRDEALAKGRELIYEALAADDHCAEVHCSMCKIALYHDDDFHAAARHVRRAVELDPYEPEALRLMSIVYKILGRTDDAVRTAKEATQRAPDVAPLWNALADSLLAAGRNAEAVDALRRAIALLPGYGPALERLELAHSRIGEFDRAAEMRVARLQLAGQRERASLIEREATETGGAEAIQRDVRRELDMLLEGAKTADPFVDYVRRNAADRIASGYAELGDWHASMDWVERAYERRPGRLRRMLADMPVDYRGLAVDPRYARVMRVAGLESQM